MIEIKIKPAPISNVLFDGGDIYGFFGTWQAIEKHFFDFAIDRVSGSGFGAFVAFLIAAKCDDDEIKAYLKKFEALLNPQNALNGMGLNKLLLEIFDEKRINSSITYSLFNKTKAFKKLILCYTNDAGNVDITQEDNNRNLLDLLNSSIRLPATKREPIDLFNRRSLAPQGQLNEFGLNASVLQVQSLPNTHIPVFSWFENKVLRKAAFYKDAFVYKLTMLKNFLKCQDKPQKTNQEARTNNALLATSEWLSIHQLYRVEETLSFNNIDEMLRSDRLSTLQKYKECCKYVRTDNSAKLFCQIHQNAFEKIIQDEQNFESDFSRSTLPIHVKPKQNNVDDEVRQNPADLIDETLPRRLPVQFINAILRVSITDRSDESKQNIPILKTEQNLENASNALWKMAKDLQHLRKLCIRHMSDTHDTYSLERYTSYLKTIETYQKKVELELDTLYKSEEYRIKVFFDDLARHIENSEWKIGFFTFKKFPLRSGAEIKLLPKNVHAQYDLIGKARQTGQWKACFNDVMELGAEAAAHNNRFFSPRKKPTKRYYDAFVLKPGQAEPAIYEAVKQSRVVAG